MENILTKVIQSVQQSNIAFCKFISANDVGKTGGHQSGYYIPKSVLPYIFESDIIKGNDYSLTVTIKWQNDFETESRFKFYGSKNECHLTRFGKGFPYLNDERVGDLLIISKKGTKYYEAFVLQTDYEFDEFFASLNISPSDTNKIIQKQFEFSAEDKLLKCFNAFLKSIKTEFPPTIELANNSRYCYNEANRITEQIIKSDPDKEILNWLDAEFKLFKVIENDRYNDRIKRPFKSVEELVETANTILNRRKSRAGKSLEHHLAEIFKIFKLNFSSQTVTEYNKKPDFLFPNIEAYNNKGFKEEKLVMLACKTTCKDRWRQILNEADRIKTKHLFTLQQGISKNQLEEMYKYNVCLVVPKQYLKSYPEEFNRKILTLDGFVNQIRDKQR